MTVNAVELHHEVRGTGPPVLFVMGATGIGAHFAQMARTADGTRAVVKELVAKGMREGGLPGALEQFWRFVAGDASWEGLEPGLREQMLASADTYFGLERGRFDAYVPPDDVLAAIAAPVAVMAGESTRPVFVQASRRLAERLGVEVTRVPGAHAPYLEHAHELAEAMRPFLREVSHSAA